MTKLRALWHEITDSLWFLPALLTLTGASLAVLLIRFNDRILGDLEPQTLWWLFGGTAEGAQGVLGAIGGSIITVTGVVFSVTIVALQLASSQFTPRVLRTFTADRANQVVLGVFIGTFTYTLIVQRTLRSGSGEAGDMFVPNVAVTGAVGLALVSIGFLIFFINHAARAIQAAVIIDSIATDTIAVIHGVFPERRSADHESGEPQTPQLEGDAHPVPARSAGYVQDVDFPGLAATARTGQVMITTEVETGSYVLPGQRIASIWPAADARPELEERIHEAFVLGMERTPHQDLKFGVVELMDIAVKALSPSVNDPTTALNAIERSSEVLLELAWRKRGDRVEYAGNGRVLVVQKRPTLQDTVDLAFNQVRHYAADNPSVSIRLMTTLAQLVELAPPDSRAPFIEHLNAVMRTAEARTTDAGDRARIANVASRALAQVNAPPAR